MLKGLGQIKTCIQRYPGYTAAAAVALVGVSLLAVGLLAKFGGDLKGLESLATQLSGHKWALIASGASITGIPLASGIVLYCKKPTSKGANPDNTAAAPAAAAAVAGDKDMVDNKEARTGTEPNGESHEMSDNRGHDEGVPPKAGDHEEACVTASEEGTGESRSEVSTVQYSDGSKYEGELNKDGECHGQGIFIDEDKTEFDGRWENDDPTGSFTVRYLDGKRYTGELNDDLNWHGQGTFTDKDETKFKGQWERDKPIGSFTVRYLDGSRYIGELNKDLEQHGQGIFIDKDENEFEGMWEDGNPTGPFTVEYADDSKYEGELNKDLEQHGQGKEYRDDGSLRFEGSFREDKFCSGKHYNRDEQLSYEGDIVNGTFHGQGTYVHGGISYKGKWKKGKPTGKFKVKQQDGGAYTGMLNNQLRFHGEGEYVERKGTTYNGKWKNGYPTGAFTVVYHKPYYCPEQPKEYIGELSKSLQPHGQGKMTNSNNYVIEGRWKDGNSLNVLEIFFKIIGLDT